MFKRMHRITVPLQKSIRQKYMEGTERIMARWNCKIDANLFRKYCHHSQNYLYRK